jgi:transcriptional regulator with XRE-family HTH domain
VNSTEALAIDMGFPERLVTLRKGRKLTQQSLADLVGVHVMQIHRYEAGASQPSLEVIKKLAVALSVTADALLFDTEERGPEDDLKLQFEAVSRLSPDEKRVIRELIEGMLIKHEVKRWTVPA